MISLLRQHNPTANEDELHVWLDAFTKYRKAETAISKSGLLGKDKNGNIVENPLLKIQERCIKIMAECGRVKNTGFMWEGEANGSQEN